MLSKRKKVKKEKVGVVQWVLGAGACMSKTVTIRGGKVSAGGAGESWLRSA